MAQTIQIRRGAKANLPSSLNPGELAYCTDTNELFIGSSTGTNFKITVQDILGSLSGLNTTAKDSIISAINELKQTTDGKVSSSQVGTLSSLSTTAKTSIIDAINELKQSIDGKASAADMGSVAGLQTTTKTTITAAINELVNKKYSIDQLDGVDVTNKTNGYAIQFDSTSGTFKSMPLPQGSGSGATNLDGLSDVDVVTIAPVEGNYLKFVGGIWQPATATGNMASDTFTAGTVVQESGITASADPSNFVVSNLTKYSFTLSWDNNGAWDVDSYNVFNNEILVGNIDKYTRSINITGLNPNTTYSIRVTAINNNGYESAGAVYSVTTQQWILGLNQVLDGDYFYSPSLPVTEFIVDVSVDITHGGYLFDGRLGMSLSAINLADNTTGTLGVGSYWGTSYLNGVQKTPPFVIPNNTRMTLRFVHTGTVGTDTFKMGHYGNWYSRMQVYGLKLYNAGTLIADYDFANKTLSDKSGNNNNGTLVGGTWL